MKLDGPPTQQTTSNKRRHDSLDALVGRRLRQRRKERDLNQSQIGDCLGVSYQQVQKYETGRDCIRASALYRLARLLDVPMEYFFEEAPARDGLDGRTMDSRKAADIIQKLWAISENLKAIQAIQVELDAIEDAIADEVEDE